MCSLVFILTRSLFSLGTLGIVLSAGGSPLRAGNSTTSRGTLEASHGNSSLVPVVSSGHIAVSAKPADRCHPSSCRLPDCRCVGTDIPGQFRPREIPQMVVLTMDDEVTVNNDRYYQGLFLTGDPVRNPNGCPVTATFFVSGTWSNMSIVKALVERGHEVASHSLSHNLSLQQPWTVQDWDREIQGMRQLLARGTGLDISQIRGMRSPNLQLGGDAQFSMLKHRGFLYDSSMYGGVLEEDGSAPLWPFTLDHPPYLPTPHAVCDQAYCPSRGYPRLWEVPLVRHYTLSGQPCAMTDSCPLNEDSSKDEIMAFLRYNFHRHYFRNRAPFMISVHPWWFSRAPSSYEALKDFLLEISLNRDVWQVTMSQMLDWVRHPKPLNRLHELPSWRCPQSLHEEEAGVVVLFATLAAMLLSLIVICVVLELRHAGFLVTGLKRCPRAGHHYQHLPLHDPDNPMEKTLLR